MGGAGAGGGWSDSAHYHPHHLSLYTLVHFPSVPQKGTVWVQLPLPPGGAISCTPIQSMASWILTRWTHPRMSRQVVKPNYGGQKYLCHACRV